MNDTMNHFGKKKSLIVIYERINIQRAESITKKSTNKHTEILSGTQTSRAIQTVTNSQCWTVYQDSWNADWKRNCIISTKLHSKHNMASYFFQICSARENSFKRSQSRKCCEHRQQTDPELFYNTPALLEYRLSN